MKIQKALGKVQRYIISLLSACLLIVPGMLYAIDKDKHPVVTERAVNTFNQCLKYLGKAKYKLSMFQGGVISEYTKREDESPVTDRASNWHFHDAFHETEHSLKSPYFIMRPSLHEIFNERVQALGYVTNNRHDVDIDYNVYLNETKEQISGRIIHYIQDMGVPEHVAPVYHSKPEGWLQRLLVADEPAAFDSLFTEENIDFLGDLKINKRACEILYSKIQQRTLSLVNVLDDFAAETRARLNNTIHGPGSPRWKDKYWPVRTKDNRYANDQFAHPDKGKYGFLERHDNVFTLPKKIAKNKENVYWQFFKQQYLLIRDNTVLVLMMIFID